MKKFGNEMMECPRGGKPHPGCERDEGFGGPGMGPGGPGMNPERMGPGGPGMGPARKGPGVRPFPGGPADSFGPGGPASGEPGFPPREGFGHPGCGPHGGPGGPHGGPRCGGPRRAPRPRGKITESPRYQKDDVNGKLVTLLRVLGHVGHHMDAKGGQGRVLSLLKEGEMTQRELTEKLGIQPGSASEIIGKLEKGGCLIRTPSLTDRRTADISLTEEGARRAEEHIARTQARREEMFSALTDEEKANLLQLLEKLYADWEEKRPPNGAE